MNRAAVRRTLPILLLLAGCEAGVPVRDRAEAPAVQAAAPEAFAETPAAACPPPGGAPRVRDLTRPWSQRVYLLLDGTTCDPAAAGAGAG